MPRKKKRYPEYRLRVFAARDERLGKPLVVVAVETIKEFVNFNYQILLEERKVGTTIHLKILGLHTPPSVMAGVGPALGIRVYAQLEGLVSIIVTRPDGEVNRFEFEIEKQSITMKKTPEEPFLTFSPDPIPFQ